MANKRYAAIASITKQVTGFVNKPFAINSKFGFVVDLENHEQADDVKIGWFYDEITNTFSTDGEVDYLEGEEPEPTEAELVQAELLLNQAEILAKQNEQDEVLAEILLSQLEV